MNGTSEAEKELQLQRREDARDAALTGLLGAGSSSGGSGNTAAAQIQAYGLGSGELLAASGYPAGVRSTDTFDGGPGVPYDRQSTIYNAEAGVVGYSVKFPEIEIRPLASNTNSFETASYDINGNATGYNEQIQLNGSSTTYLKSLSNIYHFLADPLIGTAEQIVQNPGVSLGYLYDGVVGYGKGAINVIPETGTFIYKGYRFLGAGIGEATGLLNPGALGRTIDGLEDTTGRVLNYNSYSEQIGGFTGAATSPALAFRAASVTASAYRTYASEVGQYGFGQVAIPDGASAWVDFSALGTNTAVNSTKLTGVSTSNDGIATWVRVANDPKAVVRIESGFSGQNVTDIYKGSLPSGSGSQLLATGLEATGLKSGGQFSFTGIINSETLSAYQGGVAASNSLLGKVGTNALSNMGLEASTIQYQVVRGKLNIVIGVK